MKKALHITIQILLRLFLTLAAVIVLVLIAIQFQAVQQKLIHLATSYVSDKTHTRVEIGRITISFPKNIVLENVFIEDHQHDTLLSVSELSVGADFFGLIKGDIAVSDISLTGATSRIHRTLPDSAFNFDFLIRAFVSDTAPKSLDTTASEPLTIDLGKLRLTDFKFTYDDEVVGIYTNNTIGTLYLNMALIDLGKMSFTIDEFFLARTQSLVELRPVSGTAEEPVDSSLLPHFAARKIVFEEVDFTFRDPGDPLFFNTKIGELELRPGIIDLNKQQVDIKSLVLNHSLFQLEMTGQNTDAVSAEITADSSLGWSVTATALSLSQNEFKYAVTNMPKLPKGFDYNHLWATNIALEARSLSYNEDVIKGDIRQLAVNEQSGISVQKLRTRFIYDSKHAELANLYLKTSRSTVSNYLRVSYPSIDKIAEKPGNLDMNLHLVNTKIAMQDVLIFVPELEKDPSIIKNTKQQVVVNGRIKGKLSDLQLSDVIVQTASQTAIAIDGKIKGLPDVDALWVDLQIPLFSSTRADLAVLIPDSIIPASIKVPQKIMLKGQVTGGLKNVKTNLDLHSSDGSLKVVASYKLEDTVPVYNIVAQPTLLDVGGIMGEPMIGKVTGEMKTNGRSFHPKEMLTTFTGKWSLIELNNYKYSGVVLDAAAKNGLINSRFEVKDDNIDLALTVNGSVLQDNNYANIKMSLAGANLKELKLTRDEYKISGELRADVYDILEKKLNGNIGIGNVVVMGNSKRYVLDSLLVMSINENRKREGATAVLTADYNGYTQLQNVTHVVQHCISHYWGEPMSDMDLAEENFTCVVQVNPHPILTDVLVPKLGEFYGMTLNVEYTGRNNAIAVAANAPMIEYDQTMIKNFQFKVNCEADSLMYALSVASISNPSYFIAQTSLSGGIAQRQLWYDIRIIDPDSGYKLKVAGNMQQHGDSTVLKWLKGSVVLNDQLWNIDQHNRIVIHSNGINVQQFNLTHERQFIKVNSAGTQLNAPMNIAFGDFDLRTISRIIEEDSTIVEGTLNGKVELNPADKFAFTSDLDIKRITLKGVPIGDLFVNADNLNGQRYNAKIRLSGNENDALVEGYYENEQLHMQVDIRKINIRSIEAFIPGTIKRSSGYITGKMKISGKAAEPQFNGDIALKQASFVVAAFNNRLTFNDEHILVDNEGIRFKNFTALDSMGQPLVINGAVYTTNFINMKFDLDITTKRFRVMSTTEQDNKVYYGTILLNSSIKVRGTEKLPKVDADVKLIDGSNLTFVVQQGQLDLDRGEGVVVFVDTSEHAIMKDTNTVTVSSFTGLNIRANIEVNRNTKFRIITDKTSGDNLVVSGDANLNFGIDESGKITLVGAYVLNSGTYKASMQKIVKREFEIRRGSTIVWSGDPLDASIDITATYRVRTSASDLMVSGAQDASQNKYRKLLNYDVNLMIKGFLLKPELTFNLDMPVKDQDELDGAVYAKINEINNNPNELNKQVFSLLIFGKFVPTGTGSNMSPTGAASSIARNSVNQLFTDQLNNLSGKYIKGAELNFNIQSNDDYSVAGETQQNTEFQVGLKKELFNNRVSVKVGSSVDVGTSTTPTTNQQSITGDAVFEYKITEDGEYRFKAFTENGYEGVIDGTLYKTGIGFLYTKDYDSISQLFRRPKKDDTLKLGEEKVD